MKWINVEDRWPKKETFYRCICLGWPHPLKCRFKKQKNGPREYSGAHFVHNGRCPMVLFWKEKL
jgi:hypothetical protein